MLRVAIVSTDIYAAWANLTLDEGERASIDLICGQVDTGIKKWCNRTFEQASYTLILDAPTKAEFQLTRWAPVNISGFLLYFNPGAKGDPSQFTSDNLLTMYSDYLLDVGPDTSTSSLSGVVRSLTGGFGVSYRRPRNMLATQAIPTYGALKVSFSGGYPVLPEDLVEAACIAVSKIIGVRKYGMQVGSESWNGYSYNLPGVGLMTQGILGTPDILTVLNRYVDHSSRIG